MSTKPTAIETLDSLDVEELQEAINAEEAELAEMVSERRKRIDALRILHRAADVRTNGKQTRKPRQKSAKASNSGIENPNRLRIHDYLLKHGATSASVIASSLGLPVGPTTKLLRHEWFELDTRTHDWNIAKVR